MRNKNLISIFMRNKLLMVLLLIAVLLRIALAFTIPVTGDAAWHYSYSQNIIPSISEPFSNVSVYPFFYPPLFHLITFVLHGLTGFFGLTSLLFGCLSVFAFYKLSVDFFPKLGLLPTALFSFLPMPLYFSGLGYLEELLLFNALMCSYFYFSYLKSDSRNHFVLTCVFAGLTAITHYNGVVIVASLFLHQLFKNKRAALALLIISLIIPSFWYARNYGAFGSPVWPNAFPGNYPHGSQSEFNVVNIANPAHWAYSYVDFWAGPPNVGDSLLSDLSFGESVIPFIGVFFAFWVLITLFFTYSFARGFFGLFSDDRMRFFAFVAFFSLFSLVIFSQGRMLVLATPLVVFCSSHYWKRRIKVNFFKVLFAISILSFISTCFVYAFVYNQLHSDYEDYLHSASDYVSSQRLLAFFPEMSFYTGAIPVGIADLPNRVPTAVFDSMDPAAYLSDYVDFVCCDSYKITDSLVNEKRLCDYFYENKEPVFEYNNRINASCWHT